MAGKPAWKVEFDEEVGRVQVEIAELLQEYPREAVLEAMDTMLRDETRDQWRDQFEEQHSEDQ